MSTRTVLLPVLSLVLALACTHAPRDATKPITTPATPATATPATPADRDFDGFVDALDPCPADPGPEPDGCPASDSDGDGVFGPDDRCPAEPETYNEHQDDDGCPDEAPERASRLCGASGHVPFGDRPTAKHEPPSQAPASSQAAAERGDRLAAWQRGEPERAAHTSKAIREASKLSATAMQVIECTAGRMHELPLLRVELSGHTDDREGRTAAVGLEISRARAEAVKRYMVEVEGIDPSRIEVRAVGPGDPLDSNRTAAGRAKNRRVEFSFLAP